MQRAAIKRSERIEIPVEWVLLWDVPRSSAYTHRLDAGRFDHLGGATKAYLGLGFFFLRLIKSRRSSTLTSSNL
jgi:hypothetical protein